MFTLHKGLITLLLGLCIGHQVNATGEEAISARKAQFLDFMNKFEAYTKKHRGIDGARAFLNENISDPMTATERDNIISLFDNLLQSFAKTLPYNIRICHELINQASGIMVFLGDRKENDLRKNFQPNLSAARQKLVEAQARQ